MTKENQKKQYLKANGLLEVDGITYFKSGIPVLFYLVNYDNNGNSYVQNLDDQWEAYDDVDIPQFFDSYSEILNYCESRNILLGQEYADERGNYYEIDVIEDYLTRPDLTEDYREIAYHPISLEKYTEQKWEYLEKTAKEEASISIFEVENLNELPANSIVLTYSDHYSANSGGNIYLTNNEGKIDSINHELKWHEIPEDRGVIEAIALTSDRGAFHLLGVFQRKCTAYSDAIHILREWKQGKYPFSTIELNRYTKNRSIGSREELHFFNEIPTFEELPYIKKNGHKYSRENFEAKKLDYIETRQKMINEATRILENNIEVTKKWFNENNIRLEFAHSFSNGYYFC